MSFESARAVTKKNFVNAGGYNTNISSGEDMVIQRKYEEITNVGYAKNLIFHNLTDLSLWKALKKKYNYGKTSLEYFSSENKRPTSFFLAEFYCYFRNYKLLLKHPAIGLGMLSLKILEIIAGGTGFLMTKI